MAKAPKHHRYSWTTIKKVITLRRENKLTFRDISERLARQGIDVSHKTCYKWLRKFGSLQRLQRLRELNK